MAAISRSRRSAAGIAFIVAGALFLLAIVLPLVGVSLPLLVLLAHVAVAAGTVILALGAVNNTVAKIALFASAAGWVLIILATFVALPGGLLVLAAVLAGVGALVGAVVLYVGKEITNRAALAFLVTTILALLYLLGAVSVLILGELGVLVTVLFGAALVVTGVLFRQTERGRR